MVASYNVVIPIEQQHIAKLLYNFQFDNAN